MVLRRTRKFKLALAKASDMDHLVDQCDKESWYVSLGQTIDEFRAMPVGTLSLYKPKKGRVCKAHIVYFEEKGNMSLADIITERRWHWGRGYGSIVLRNVIKISWLVGAKSITGELSGADAGHFDMLKHFYEKHGFVVDMKSGGRIRRELDDCQNL